MFDLQDATGLEHDITMLKVQAGSNEGVIEANQHFLTAKLWNQKAFYTLWKQNGTRLANLTIYEDKASGSIYKIEMLYPSSVIWTTIYIIFHQQKDWLNEDLQKSKGQDSE